MAANLFSLGKVTVPIPGTPVALTVPTTINPPSVHAILIEVLATNTGKIYIGLAGLNKTTLAGVLIVLAVPTANSLPTFSIAVTQAANALSLPQLRFDVDNANDGVLVSGIVA